MRRNVTTALVAGALALAACAPDPQRIPAGTYDSRIEGTRSEPDGDWTLAIDADGRFRLARDGQAAVTGRYESDDARVTFVDESGPMMCAAGATSGSYTWRLEERQLLLGAVADDCPSRRTILDS